MTSDTYAKHEQDETGKALISLSEKLHFNLWMTVHAHAAKGSLNVQLEFDGIIHLKCLSCYAVCVCYVQAGDVYFSSARYSYIFTDDNCCPNVNKAWFRFEIFHSIF